MSRWSVGLLRIVFALVMAFLAGIVSISVSAIFHSHSSLLSGITFVATIICLFLFFERAFPFVYSGLSRPRPWWQTRAAELPIAIAFVFIISILSSRIATLWFGLLIISGLLVALLLRVTRRGGESLGLPAVVDSGTRSQFAHHTYPQSGPRSSGKNQIDETLRPTRMWGKPPFSIPDNYAIDVRNLAAVSDWYREKLGLREAHDDREEDSGRAFIDLHISNSDPFVSLVELPSGESAENRHVIFFAKNLNKTHEWLAARGVLVEPITIDSGGNRLFRFRDLEGNTIEMCVEPK
jgi:catechol 2,3-dioxygenase-like lactoylglutathione lyase family enzyme/branched-subunit amino acid transport protein AzlD